MGPTNKKARTAAPAKSGGRTVATVSAAGDVDRAGLEACDYYLSRAGEHVTGAVVDLTGATHLDYRATTILVARRRYFKARGGELAIAAGRSEVRNIIRASVGAEIPVFVTVAEALAWVRGDAVMATAASRTLRSGT